MDAKNDELDLEKLSEYKSTIEEFLIKSYSMPFTLQPFPERIDEYLKFMDYVADYLCSIVEKSDEKPLISVIMPVYNRKDIVMNAIDSVLSQSYDNFELIIVDDASTDGTAELLEELNHEKIRVFFHTENKDCSGARNTGLKNAKGEYITYLDSDNLMDEKFLQANLGAFLLFNDADCVYSAQIRYNEYESEPHTLLFGSLNKLGLHYRNFVDANTIFHKRSILDRIGGFDETLLRGEDWDFILRITNNFKVYSIPVLQSKYYTKLKDDRMTETRPAQFKKIREKNAKFYTDCTKLSKKVNIIIPVYSSHENIMECLKSIFSLNLDDKIKVIISNNNPEIKIGELDLNMFKNNNIELVESKTNLGFSDSLIKGIEHSDDDADIVILNQKAILTEGALESMQKYAYTLKKCGLVASAQLVYNPPLVKEYFYYVDEEYWIDVTPFIFEDNIVEIPPFYDSEFLNINAAPFFCTYLKRDVIKGIEGINFEFEDGEAAMLQLSEYIRNEMKLEIFTTSDAMAFQCRENK